MTNDLFVQAVTKYLLGVFLAAALIFMPAGTFAFAGGWIFMITVFVPVLIAGILMMRRNPELLRKRLKSKERAKEQDLVVKLSGLMFLAGFIVAGLNVRFQWCVLSVWISLPAAAVFIVGYLLYAQVLRENEFLSRVIEIQENQRVIDTGLYAVVRHPMYSATLLMFLSMPLMLGSWISFLIFLVYPVLIGRRILHEEAFLEQKLDGYRAYKQKVRYRLIPFVW